MVGEQTVFVLGAGASHAYGFPTGPELKGKIIHGLAREDSTFFRAVEVAAGADPLFVAHFRKDFQEARRTSIDRFLQARPEFLRIGKAAIARVLMPLEKPTRLYRPAETDWYEYLLDRIIGGDSPAFFRRNRLTIITFNFDRSFETAMFRALRASYGLSDIDAAQLAKHVPVIHVHGDLGRLELWAGHGGEGWGRPYEPSSATNEVSAAANRIHLVHEEVTDEDLRPALSAIRDATVVCFLGFGYHHMNLERLRLPLHLRGTLYDGTRLHGSTFGMEPGEMGPAQRAFQGLDYKLHPMSIVEFLRKLPHIHDD